MDDVLIGFTDECIEGSVVMLVLAGLLVVPTILLEDDVATTLAVCRSLGGCLDTVLLLGVADTMSFPIDVGILDIVIG